MSPLALIVAMTPSGVIGQNGKIPWRYSEDLKRFKALTVGHAILMGRKTFDSIGKALPERRNIVISRRGPSAAGDVEWFDTFEGALESAYMTDSEPFVIGGAEIYKLALPLATRAEITLVHEQKISGDGIVRFPDESAPLSSRSWGPWRLSKAKSGDAWEIEYLTFERRQR